MVLTFTLFSCGTGPRQRGSHDAASEGTKIAHCYIVTGEDDGFTEVDRESSYTKQEHCH